jgi:hypothetical protein
MTILADVKQVFAVRAESRGSIAEFEERGSVRKSDRRAASYWTQIQIGTATSMVFRFKI